MSIETREVFSEIEIITARFILDMCQLYEVQHFKNPEKVSALTPRLLTLI